MSIPSEISDLAKRPETGYMQFGNDWRGIFIRGDNAFGYFLALRLALTAADINPLTRRTLDGLRQIFEGVSERDNPITEVQKMLPFDQCADPAALVAAAMEKAKGAGE